MPHRVRCLLYRTLHQLADPRHARWQIRRVRCIQLTSDNRCQLFNEPARPLICRRFEPDAQTCGQDNAFAMHYLARLERDTAGC